MCTSVADHTVTNIGEYYCPACGRIPEHLYVLQDPHWGCDVVLIRINEAQTWELVHLVLAWVAALPRDGR